MVCAGGRGVKMPSSRPPNAVPRPSTSRAFIRHDREKLAGIQGRRPAGLSSCRHAERADTHALWADLLTLLPLLSLRAFPRETVAQSQSCAAKGGAISLVRLKPQGFACSVDVLTGIPLAHIHDSDGSESKWPQNRASQGDVPSRLQGLQPPPRVRAPVDFVRILPPSAADHRLAPMHC